MTIAKQLVPFILVLVLILPSCTVNHPLYTSNYHIEWKKFKHNNSKRIFSDSIVQNKMDSENEVVRAIIQEQDGITIQEDVDNAIASTDPSIIVIPSKKSNLNKTTASIKKTYAAVYANKTIKTDHEKSSKIRKKIKGPLKALYIFLLALAITGLVLASMSLFGTYFLFTIITVALVVLTLGILIILGS